MLPLVYLFFTTIFITTVKASFSWVNISNTRIGLFAKAGITVRAYVYSYGELSIVPNEGQGFQDPRTIFTIRAIADMIQPDDVICSLAASMFALKLFETLDEVSCLTNSRRGRCSRHNPAKIPKNFTRRPGRF
ncbi:hypothetical protein HANVADRAFT_53495 [Hanseniaspora valbyensis NRRL Y-1626]|uniref:Uncharacterized protein n=1 Tax=Hanseniaspora valbyensis NRRL Y-1626 TaxID=766949 RepID=A0A1B7TBE9_9ASCO|nr:hypothetical protein HANVADRAFT_53495 [Hanseniaspora valbyensis NRRL Y-1626]